MWFKVYFYMVSVVYVVLTIKSTIVGTPISRTLHLVDSMLTILALVGLFGYLYKKDFLTKRFWRVYTFVFIGWQVLYLIFSVFQQPKSTPISLFLFVVLLTVVIAAIFLAPLIIGLFKYSKDSKNQNNSGSRELEFAGEFKDITEEILKGEIPEDKLFKMK